MNPRCYTYADCIQASERVAWRLDDVMPPDARLDFARPFLPELLTGTACIPFLDAGERLRLNQINGNAYLNLFAFIEEYVTAQVSSHAQAELFGNRDAVRALSRFADEELKHQQLFGRYRDAFNRDFVCTTFVLGAPEDVARVILEKSPIAAMLVTYQLELTTQAHYTLGLRGRADLDPLFVRLLHHHWLEESQHARIDALELDKLVASADRAELEQAFADYTEIVIAFDDLLGHQAEFDADSFERAQRGLSRSERATLVAAQHAGYRRAFLTLGLRNRAFTSTLQVISDEGAARVARLAAELSPQGTASGPTRRGEALLGRTRRTGTARVTAPAARYPEDRPAAGANDRPSVAGGDRPIV